MKFRLHYDHFFNSGADATKSWIETSARRDDEGRIGVSRPSAERAVCGRLVLGLCVVTGPLLGLDSNFNHT